MDLPLFGTMQKLGCRHPMDMFYDPLIRAKIESVPIYYRGMKVSPTLRPDRPGQYEFIYASIETGFIFRDLTSDTARELTIRQIDNNRLLGIPYDINYEVPVEPVKTDYDPNRDNRNAGVEDASELIVLGLSLVVTASVLYKRSMNDGSSATKGKK